MFIDLKDVITNLEPSSAIDLTPEAENDDHLTLV